MAENIIVKSISLQELFDMQLVIPEYQRPYVWTQIDIDKLFRQVEIYKQTIMPEKPMFYLGSIVLHEDRNGNYNVIDGQQRITTLGIMHYIKSSSVLPIMYDNLISHQSISDNYEYLTKMEEIDNIVIDEINVTLIITKNEDDAYNFFETLNTGGKRLSGIDIIKAHQLRSVIEVNKYAIIWENNQAYIEATLKLLIKGRKWDILNFGGGDIPSRRSDLQDWKNVIIDEFSEKTLKGEDVDVSYSLWKRNGNMLQQLSTIYSIRQPVFDGRNFINYMVSYIELYKHLFVFDTTQINDVYYYQFNAQIIDEVDGTIDLRAAYQLILLCYASKFGFEKIYKASLWIFRYIYSLRVSVPKMVQEKTVINHILGNKIIDRILSAYTENEILSWLTKYEYTVNREYMNGVKGRFINRVSKYFALELDDNCSDFDIKLVQKFIK